jgi:hypothetical protein
MGAFFLYKKNAHLNLGDVKKVFSMKGFSEPYIFDLGSSELLLYKKQLIDQNNFIVKDNVALYLIGTVTYKSEDYSGTKELLLHDFQHDNLDLDAFCGNYCLIFYDGNEVTLLNDSLNVQHLFTDEKHNFITSSFLGATSAVPEKLKLNRLACYEKLTTGYIVGEETLFKQIIHITKSVQKSGVGDWSFINTEHVQTPKSFDNQGRKESAAEQVNAIVDYIKRIEKLAEQYKPEIGLSGGYDSRLLYAATFQSWPFKIAVHTHATEGVAIHDQEKEIVKKMAAAKGSELKIIPTKNMNAYTDIEIEDILKDGLYFFDGRCAYNMGAFSPVYTRKYKMSIVGNKQLTLNGLGGEMYRNYYMVSRPYIHCEEWMKAHIYCQGVDEVFVDSLNYSEMHQHICDKMEKELGFPWRKWISNFNMRRYYSELRMPDCDALNCNAHNQLQFYLTPFIERSLIEKAYRGYKYIGISGEYQAEIIRQLDSELASFPSHYGFNFSSREPIKYKFYMAVRGLLPDKIWNARVKYVTRRQGEKNRNLIYFKDVANKCNYLKRAADFTERLFPELNFDLLRKDYAMMPNSSYISVLLYEFRERLQFD